VERWTAQGEGQTTFASWIAVKTASVLAATKIAAAEYAVAYVNSAAISASSAFAAGDKLIVVIAAVAVAAFLPFAFVQYTYLVKCLVLSHYSLCSVA